ncbi:nucleotidyltransferase family protein [Bacillus massiliglaciei]|uniref:nucleotidyltransferase family protein n=1 Tax=Bacillus massiliglaciei TaxID=1816693 RepID=UPI000A547064|nr:nucleotidyltransferase family protein [Bacillus massiliglaciei]
MSTEKGGVVGVYLAAGSSRRMGSSKLLLPLGKSMVGNFAFAAALESKLDHLLVITQAGDPLDWMNPLFKGGRVGSRWTQKESLEAWRGQAYSLKKGIECAVQREAEAVLLLLADQPFVTAGMLNELLSVFYKEKKHGKEWSFIASLHQQMARPPVLFTKRMFPNLLKLEGDEGARQLIRNSRHDGKFVAVQAELPFYDIDTQAQYEHAKGWMNDD